MSKKIKEIVFVMIVAGLIITASCALMIGLRVFSNVTTTISIKSPKPGIECATLISGDGVAIDCWKVEK